MHFWRIIAAIPDRYCIAHQVIRDTAMTATPKFRSTLLAGLLATLLSGCASVPHVKPQVQTFTAQSVGLDAAATAPAAGDWWKAFNEPPLAPLRAGAGAPNHL